MTTISINVSHGAWAQLIPGRSIGSEATTSRATISCQSAAAGTRRWTVERGWRSRRVPHLLGLVLALSLVDLALTIGHMQTIGMVEANPLIHLLLHVWNSGWMVAIFKVATLVLGLGTLFALRHHRQAEIAAWFIALILAGVCIMWLQYMVAMAGIDQTALAAVMGHEPEWIRFE